MRRSGHNFPVLCTTEAPLFASTLAGTHRRSAIAGTQEQYAQRLHNAVTDSLMQSVRDPVRTILAVLRQLRNTSTTVFSVQLNNSSDVFRI